jgi:hypothetical protein
MVHERPGHGRGMLHAETDRRGGAKRRAAGYGLGAAATRALESRKTTAIPVHVIITFGGVRRTTRLTSRTAQNHSSFGSPYHGSAFPSRCHSIPVCSGPLVLKTLHSLCTASSGSIAPSNLRMSIVFTYPGRIITTTTPFSLRSVARERAILFNAVSEERPIPSSRLGSSGGDMKPNRR